jgi:Protein of unknown function (DUF2914)
MRILLISYVLSVLLLGQSLAENAPPRILEMAVTTKVVKGMPIDSVHRISSAAVKSLYCFTRVASTSAGEGTIKHVWYRNNAAVAEYELPIKGEQWRTYSKKPIAPGDEGDWRVEVLDSSGRQLKTIKFRMN